MAARERAPRDARRLSHAPRGGRARCRVLRIRARALSPRGTDRRAGRCPALRTATYPCRTPPRSSRRASWRPTAGMRVLDACAAPGRQGLPSRRARARPRGARRARRRLGTGGAHRVEPRAARLVGTDRRRRRVRPADWWDGRPFERILLDVPCSGSGVIRRHPDIKLLRRVADIARFAARQSELLAACWDAARAGRAPRLCQLLGIRRGKCRGRGPLPGRTAAGGGGDRIC